MAISLESFSQQLGVPLWLLLIVVAWSLIWKALALWKSARKNHIVWFILFILIHTIGILEILYLFLFSKINLDSKAAYLKKERKKKRGKRNAK